MCYIPVSHRFQHVHTFWVLILEKDVEERPIVVLEKDLLWSRLDPTF